MEVIVGLAGEADDDVGRERHVRHVLADLGDAVQVPLAVVGPPHGLEDAARPRLERQVDVLADRGEVHVGADDVLAHVLGVGARVADPLDPLRGVEHAEELREGRLLALWQVAAVRVHVLSQQRDLAHAVVRKTPDLIHQLRGRTAHLTPAGGGDYAVRAGAVAANRDLDPGLELALAVSGQVPGEALELEESLGGQAVTRQELGELGHLSRAERNVDEGEALEDLVLERLGPAAADAHDPLGVLGLEPLRLAEVAEQPVVGRLTDRAGVEEDHVRRRAVVRLPVAERLEHALHALRVVLVHLAPEGGDVVALHGPSEG